MLGAYWLTIPFVFNVDLGKKKKMKKYISMSIVLCLMSVGTSSADLVGFDGYSDGTNINGINLGGVTVTATDGVVGIHTGGSGGVGYVSPRNAIAASSWNAGMKLLLTFDALVSDVSIVAGDSGGDTDRWSMEAFDDSMTSLGLADTGVFSGADPVTPLVTTFGDYRTLALSGLSGARYVELTQVTWGVAWDDLNFTVVPVPGAFLLGMLGLSVAGARLRKKSA